MNSSLIKCLQLILIIINCQLSKAVAPTMSPDKNEIYLNEGDPLDITCNSLKEMNFYYPNITIENKPITSPAIIKQFFTNTTTHTVMFHREKTIPGDTGWYGCADTDVNVTPEVYNENNVKWMYVFVQSNTTFILDDSQMNLYSAVGDSVLIPCRPTSPKHDLELALNHEILDVEQRGSYDPRKGFTINRVQLIDAGLIYCGMANNDIAQKRKFILHVSKLATYTSPVGIIEEPLNYVVEGQDLHVDCLLRIDSVHGFTLNWIPPQNWSNRVYQNLTKNHLKSPDVYEIYQTLTIKQISYEDEGDYKCELKSHLRNDSKKVHITVNDSNIKFINLTAAHDESNYDMMVGSNITWVAYLIANPTPEIAWISPQNRIITTDNQKYLVTMKYSEIILQIFDIVKEDAGLYTLEVKHIGISDPLIEKLFFNLSVVSEPLVTKFENIRPYYAPNEDIDFLCEINAYPRPNVAWSFRELDSSEHKSKPKLLETFFNEVIHSLTKSTLSMTIKESGILRCEAENEYGRHAYEQAIFVSDVPSGFGILEPPKYIIIGDDVELICGASIYNYTDSLKWGPIENTEHSYPENRKINITNTQTPFSYRSILYINNIDKSNEKSYTCNVKTIDGSTKEDKIKLEVYDPSKPYLIEGNMNGTENIYNTETARETIIEFKCHVGGMPPPIVTWWKDDQIINKTDDVFIFSDHENEHELEIKYPRIQDSGKYSCKAENRYGKIEMYHQIMISNETISGILIVSIVILLIICVILVIYFSIKVHREKIIRKQLMEAGLTHFEEGALECLNPELTVDDQAELLPYDKKWEFPRERLKFGKQLGCGAFGVVMKAEADGICEGESSTTVAVKMVRRSTESTYIRALASELKIMVHLGKHLNVVNLLGACTRNIAKRELLVIVEYCRFGNLHNYLLRHRSEFINQINPATGKFDSSIDEELLTKSINAESKSRIKYAALSFSRSNSSSSMNSNNEPDLISCTFGGDSSDINMSPDETVLDNNSAEPKWRSNYRGDYKDQNLKPIRTQDLLSWAFQVARGMEYLSQRKVLHGDLAARNILLSEDNIVKICDFGLAKTMYKDENYKKKGDAPLPIKWMAIESIRDRVFSTQSDIWSFGIVLWEFFTLAETPYPGMTAEKQYEKLIEGYRMEKPKFSTDDIYDIMLQCWRAKPNTRPTFTDLVQSVGDLLDESVKTHYLNLNIPYMDMNTMIFENGKNDYLTMMSAPDHEILLSSKTREYVNSPNIPLSPTTDCSYIRMTPSNENDDARIFSVENERESTHFNFPSPEPKSSVSSDSESEAVELSPMLRNDDDNYLKPINVQERRAEFARQRQAMKNAMKEKKLMERDSGYCNTPSNLGLIDIQNDDIKNELNKNNKSLHGVSDKKNTNNLTQSFIKTQDNYVNLPKHNDDFRIDNPDSFTNPSYIFVTNPGNRRAKV